MAKLEMERSARFPHGQRDATENAITARAGPGGDKLKEALSPTTEDTWKGRERGAGKGSSDEGGRPRDHNGFGVRDEQAGQVVNRLDKLVATTKESARRKAQRGVGDTKVRPMWRVGGVPQHSGKGRGGGGLTVGDDQCILGT